MLKINLFNKTKSNYIERKLLIKQIINVNFLNILLIINNINILYNHSGYIIINTFLNSEVREVT